MAHRLHFAVVLFPFLCCSGEHLDHACKSHMVVDSEVDAMSLLQRSALSRRQTTVIQKSKPGTPASLNAKSLPVTVETSNAEQLILNLGAGMGQVLDVTTKNLKNDTQGVSPDSGTNPSTGDLSVIGNTSVGQFEGSTDPELIDEFATPQVRFKALSDPSASFLQFMAPAHLTEVPLYLKTDSVASLLRLPRHRVEVVLAALWVFMVVSLAFAVKSASPRK